MNTSFLSALSEHYKSSQNAINHIVHYIIFIHMPMIVAIIFEVLEFDTPDTPPRLRRNRVILYVTLKFDKKYELQWQTKGLQLLLTNQ